LSVRREKEEGGKKKESRVCLPLRSEWCRGGVCRGPLPHSPRKEGKRKRADRLHRMLCQRGREKRERHSRPFRCRPQSFEEKEKGEKLFREDAIASSRSMPGQGSSRKRIRMTLATLLASSSSSEKRKEERRSLPTCSSLSPFFRKEGRKGRPDTLFPDFSRAGGEGRRKKGGVKVGQYQKKKEKTRARARLSRRRGGRKKKKKGEMVCDEVAPAVRRLSPGGAEKRENEERKEDRFATHVSESPPQGKKGGKKKNERRFSSSWVIPSPSATPASTPLGGEGAFSFCSWKKKERKKSRSHALAQRRPCALLGEKRKKSRLARGPKKEETLVRAECSKGEKKGVSSWQSVSTYPRRPARRPRKRPARSAADEERKGKKKKQI